MHDNLSHFNKIPPVPVYGKDKNVGRDLAAYWDYASGKGISDPLIPLIWDGSVNNIFWLPYNKIADSDIFFDNETRELINSSHGYVRNDYFAITGSPDGNILFEHNDKFSGPGRKVMFSLYTSTFEDFARGNIQISNYGLFWDNLRKIGEEKIIVSIDARRFISQDVFDRRKFPLKQGLIEYGVNPRSFEGFCECIKSIKKNLGWPRTYIYTEYTGPVAAKEILARLIGMI